MTQQQRNTVDSVADAGSKAGKAARHRDRSNERHWRTHAEWDIDTLKAGGIDGQGIFDKAYELAHEVA